jgi:hypothetical protein
MAEAAAPRARKGAAHDIGEGPPLPVVREKLVRWLPERIVKGMPYDTPLVESHTTNANFLRLWSAVAPEEFDLE